MPAAPIRPDPSAALLAGPGIIMGAIGELRLARQHPHKCAIGRIDSDCPRIADLPGAPDHAAALAVQGDFALPGGLLVRPLVYRLVKDGIARGGYRTDRPG